MINYTNYFLTLIGLGMIIISLFFIFSDKLKGEGLYFDLYVKEQEIKKAISDADEVIDELKYTSEAIINEIEQNISEIKKHLEEAKKLEREFRKDQIKSKETTNSKNIKVNRIGTNKKANLIYEHYNNGMDVGDIAKLLNIGKGEVSLILSLYDGDANNENL